MEAHIISAAAVQRQLLIQKRTAMIRFLSGKRTVYKVTVLWIIRFIIAVMWIKDLAVNGTAGYSGRI